MIQSSAVPGFLPQRLNPLTSIFYSQHCNTTLMMSRAGLKAKPVQCYWNPAANLRFAGFGQMVFGGFSCSMPRVWRRYRTMSRNTTKGGACRDLRTHGCAPTPCRPACRNISTALPSLPACQRKPLRSYDLPSGEKDSSPDPMDALGNFTTSIFSNAFCIPHSPPLHCLSL